jgi:hypothetical protein
VTSFQSWMPLVAARSQSMFAVEDGDPAQRQSCLLRVRTAPGEVTPQRLEVDVGLIEAVEQHQTVGAGHCQPVAIAAIDEKYGAIFTATGIPTPTSPLRPG